MRIRSAAIVAFTLIAAPALAGDVEIYQVGQSNWAAANQYNRVNTVMIHQKGLNANGNNYAAFAQEGRSNTVNSAQSSFTDNALEVTQAGRDNYAIVFQSADRLNKFALTQNRLRRR